MFCYVYTQLLHKWLDIWKAITYTFWCIDNVRKHSNISKYVLCYSNVIKETLLHILFLFKVITKPEGRKNTEEIHPGDKFGVRKKNYLNIRKSIYWYFWCRNEAGLGSFQFFEILNNSVSGFI